MDYFIYLSESKVEMLYAQLPLGLAKQLSAEIGASIGLLSTKLKTSATEPSLYEKAKAVELYLLKHYEVGKLANPNEWIQGALDVRHITTGFSPELFLLIGKFEQDYFLLGGSAHNIIGNRSPATVSSPLSYFPYFMGAFKEGFKKWEMSSEIRSLWVDTRPKWAQTEWIGLGGNPDELAWSIRDLYEHSSKVPSMKVQFLGKRLAEEALVSILGKAYVYSPLYVAQAA